MQPAPCVCVFPLFPELVCAHVCVCMCWLCTGFCICVLMCLNACAHVYLCMCVSICFLYAFGYVSMHS